VLDEVVRKITDIFSFDQVTIYLFNAQRESLYAAASFGHQEEAPPPRAFRRGQDLRVGWRRAASRFFSRTSRRIRAISTQSN
jgi:hypothetical protein